MLMPLTNPTRAYGQTTDVAVCSVAQGLVDRGLPVRALSFITAANAPGGCSEEWRKATDKIEASFRQARDAQNLLTEKKWQEARAEADAALVTNADNKAALLTHEAALAEMRKEPPSQLQVLQEGWKGINERQLTPLVGLLIPFIALLVSLLIAARLLVLLVPRWPSLERNPKPGRPRRILVVGLIQLVLSSAMLSFGLAGGFGEFVWLPVLVSLILAILTWEAVGQLAPFEETLRGPEKLHSASLLVVALIPTALVIVGIGTLTAGLVLGAILAAVLGIFLTAWWLATTLRVEIKVTHEDDQEKRAEAALVTALLYELGAQKPRGLEVPRGADVTALAGALTALPENAIGKAIRQVLATLLGTTPWVANIEGGKDGRTVSISRNGRTAASVLIDRQTYGAAGPTTDTKGATDPLAEAPLRMASAFILFTLAQEHPSIKNGLAGASDWRSVGLHYIATTMLVADSQTEQRQQMLARALDLDSGNLAAQLAYRHATDRKSTNPRVLIDYREWLKARERELVKSQLAQSALLLRARYMRTVVATNAVFAKVPPESKESSDLEKASVRMERAAEALLDLDELVHALEKVEDLKPIISSVQDNSEGLRRLLLLSWTAAGRWDGSGHHAESPTALYNDACYHASKHSWELLYKGIDDPPEPQQATGDDEKAVILLRQAVSVPEIKGWMLDDPQLGDFRGRHAFRDYFLQEPASDFYACSTIKPHAGPLRAGGYGNFAILAALYGNPDPLADVIPANALIRRSIVDFAYLRSRFPSNLQQSKWALEMLNQLASLGLASRASICRLEDDERKYVAKAVAEEIVKGFKTGEDDSNMTAGQLTGKLQEQIHEWLGSVR